MSKIVLKLFIAGQSSRSERAVSNLRQARDKMGLDLDLVIIDVLEQPELAEDNRILAVPTLIKESPLPCRRIIGDLSDQVSLFRELDLNASQSEGSHS